MKINKKQIGELLKANYEEELQTVKAITRYEERPDHTIRGNRGYLPYKIYDLSYIKELLDGKRVALPTIKAGTIFPLSPCCPSSSASILAAAKKEATRYIRWRYDKVLKELDSLTST